jgi:probable rRNA maturation factor
VVLLRALETNNVSGSVEVSLVITDDVELQKLNRQYRGVDAPTDVLSFSQTEAAARYQPVDFPNPGELARPLGDIIISGDRVRAQSVEYGHPGRRELAYLAVHGLLHLLGFDHEIDADRVSMRQAEENALESVPRS